MEKKSVNFYWWFGLIIVSLILLLGILLIFSNYFVYVPINYRIIFGGLIISYGAFRLVGIILKSKKQDDEDE